MTACELAHDQNSVLIVFPKPSVNAPNADSFRIDFNR